MGNDGMMEQTNERLTNEHETNKRLTNVEAGPWCVDGRPVEVRCFLCGEWFELQCSRKGKPYGVCPLCGYQIFFRLAPGIVRLTRAARERRVDNVRLKGG